MKTIQQLTTRVLLGLVATIAMVACASEERKNNEETSAELTDTKQTTYTQVANVNMEAPATINFTAKDDRDAVFAAYMTIGELFDKCGFSSEQRKLLAAAIISEIEDPVGREYVQNLILDPDNSGIKFSEPIYATANVGFDNNGEPIMEAILVAEVSNVDTLDMLTADLGISQRNGVRYYTINDDDLDITMGYNSNYFVTTLTTDTNSHKLFTKTLDNPNTDLSVFGNRDMAIYVNDSKIIDFAYQMTQARSLELQEIAAYSDDEYEADDARLMLESTNENLELLAMAKSLMGDDFRSVIGLTFEAGRIVLDMRYTGGSDMYADCANKLNNSNLKYIPHSALGFINIGFDGPEVVNAIKRAMTPEIENMAVQKLGFENVNEFRMVLGIAYDVISSIDGDVTIALNDFSIAERVVYEYGDYTTTTELDDIEAIAIADVCNNYIFDNLSFIPDLTKSGNSYYLAIEDGIMFNAGQVNNDFYAGINTSAEKEATPSLKSKWAEEFDNSIGCLVIDIQNCLNIPAVKKQLNSAYSNMTPQQLQAAKQLAGMFDSVWLNAGNDKSIELVINMTDSHTNALTQLVNLSLNIIKSNM